MIRAHAEAERNTNSAAEEKNKSDIVKIKKERGEANG